MGLRDRALIAAMFFTFARVGAVVAMTVEDYYPQGKRGWLRLQEKGGKQHDMPAHHTLEAYLDEYVKAAGIAADPRGPPLPHRARHEAGADPQPAPDRRRLADDPPPGQAGRHHDQRSAAIASGPPASPTTSTTTARWTLASHTASFDNSIRACYWPSYRQRVGWFHCPTDLTRVKLPRSLNACGGLAGSADPGLPLTHLIDPKGLVVEVERQYESCTVFVVVTVKNDVDIRG